MAIEVEMIRLIIVEDQPAVRKGLQMRLAAEVDLSVVGYASNSQTAIDLAMSLCPEVVLIDIDMLHMDGFATAAALHTLCPQSLIIILSLHDDVLTRTHAKEVGAAAFITKSLSADRLPAMIRQVAHV